MPERYALYDIDKLRDRFSLQGGVPKGVKKRYNISPTQIVPVVLRRHDAIVMEQMQWGFVPQNAKDANSVFRYKTFSVRSEDIFKKVTWEKSIRTQRCLVPANGFYIWEQTSHNKKPYYVQSTTQQLIALAGIYSTWTTPDGVIQGMFSIVTVPPNKETRPITPRLPVIIEPHEQDAWLDPTIDDMATLYDIMRTTPHNTLSVVPVSEAINSRKIDNPTLIVGSERNR